MFYKSKQWFGAFLAGLPQVGRGPKSLVFLASAGLATQWFGLPALLLSLPILLIIITLLGQQSRTQMDGASVAMRAHLNRTLSEARRTGQRTACFILQIDDYDILSERYGRSATDRVTVQSLDRLARALRAADQLFDLGAGRIGIFLFPINTLELEPLLTLASRLQSAVEEPIMLGATTVYISASLGFCPATHAPTQTSDALFDAALTALDEARRHGPSAIRAFSRDLCARVQMPQHIAEDLQQAFKTGQLISWFQPQICTNTGEISGFEALARWQHPTAGLITPAEFLPLLAASGRMEVLGDAMLSNALRALQTWDNLGLDIPHVGVNFSPEELRNPQLADKIAWELDRCNLPPTRLAVEILETVLATSSDDVITRNIAALADMGCLIDLDDFGTGHASISTIRRFAVGRLKIDRSFVTKIDRDSEQQRMVAAILSMAERLDLATLAEGVETAGEHAMLAQLGCGHVQGFGIGRPMPLDATPDWIAAHRAKLAHLPRITRAKG